MRGILQIPREQQSAQPSYQRIVTQASAAPAHPCSCTCRMSAFTSTWSVSERAGTWYALRHQFLLKEDNVAASSPLEDLLLKVQAELEVLMDDLRPLKLRLGLCLCTFLLRHGPRHAARGRACLLLR